VGADNVKLDLNIANPPSSADTDGDGMPNTWETTYGLNPNNAADASQDADGDGITNLQEYQGGSDPTNPASPGGGGGGYYDPITGVYVGIPSLSGGGTAGEGANGDHSVNDSCGGSVGAAGTPGFWNLLLLAGIGILAGRKGRGSGRR
jgi:hypothetical protein